jgi:(1->4)-alpha-D-glucan 1-alpha-D-glucosylmutase
MVLDAAVTVREPSRILAQRNPLRKLFMNTHEFALELIREAARLAAPRHLMPESTYRLQLHSGFTIRDATAIVPYLRELGITHCYASPLLKAAAGSTHGYDVVDFGSINPEIGSPADFDAWSSALLEHGLGQIADFVPNHMGVGTNENRWWNDVLENGPGARFASYFDIAWHASSRPSLHNRVLLPVLAEPYGDVLEAGMLRLNFAEGAFFIEYGNRRFPLAPASYAPVLGCGIEEWSQKGGDSDSAVNEVKSILTAIRNLPDCCDLSAEKLAERERESTIVKGRLRAICSTSESARRHLEEALAKFNGSPGDSRSFDLLDELLEKQCYRLAYWRVAPDEINYRRFFDVNELAALNMERDDVFDAAHELVLRWVAGGQVNGLRIDHPDGLYDPAMYFDRLQKQYRVACARQVFEARHAHENRDWSDLERALGGELAPAAHHAWENAGGPALYVVAEKILGSGESLVESWPVSGTTGYEFLNEVNNLFVDRDGRGAVDRLYRVLVDDDSSFSEVARRSKKLILEVSLASELHMLTGQLDRLAARSRRSRDFTFNTLRQALSELIASFPVYRTYIDDRGSGESDRRYIDQAIRRSSAGNPLLSRRVLKFIRDLLLADGPDLVEREDRRRFAGKFQQVTSPVAAKGVEDTAFYVYNRLVSLNEVGGDPAAFGSTTAHFHGFCQARQGHWPFALSPLSTHDTKRSEDVRARINVLSEIPEEWFRRLERWRGWNARHRRAVDDLFAPDANEEYLLYQTLVGAWPLGTSAHAVPRDFVERIQNYMVKAGHEAKRHSSWINPDQDYDDAIRAFVGLILDERSGQPFLDDFRAFQREVSGLGLLNSLGQTLLKLAAPGVVDTFQGCELWDFSLVDPDNRRPVDYSLRQSILGDLKRAIEAEPGTRTPLCRELVASKDDGRIKLFLHYAALGARRDNPQLFTTGAYDPLEVEGAKAANLLAFSRGSGETRAVVAMPRLWSRLLADKPNPGTSELTSNHPATESAPPSRQNGGVPESYDLESPPELRIDWLDTRLMLSGHPRFSRWWNVCTGEAHHTSGDGATLSLSGADLFANFPVALLLNDPSSRLAV